MLTGFISVRAESNRGTLVIILMKLWAEKFVLIVAAIVRFIKEISTKFSTHQSSDMHSLLFSAAFRALEGTYCVDEITACMKITACMLELNYLNGQHISSSRFAKTQNCMFAQYLQIWIILTTDFHYTPLLACGK
jgi:hypothetical protein